jgi:ubiquinone/menaquinone biosynthesis C-methylase UbiE
MGASPVPSPPSGAGRIIRDALGAAELSADLDLIGRFFDIHFLTAALDGKQDIVDYYNSSAIGYRFFHSGDGSIHMALNPDGRFDKDGYLGQARLVERYIKDEHSTAILELACGTGFNLAYLAQREPGVSFTGIDLTPRFVRRAQRVVRGHSNAKVSMGDFQKLGFSPATFDLVFVIESLCHATDMDLALREVWRVLRPGGIFIVIDGFRQPDFDTLDDRLKLAARLSEVSMAVTRPWNISAWLSLAAEVGFRAESDHDLSTDVMPNLLRLRHLSNGYFNHRVVRGIAQRLASPRLLQNAVAGRLLPVTTKLGAHTYRAIVLRRP